MASLSRPFKQKMLREIRRENAARARRIESSQSCYDTRRDARDEQEISELEERAQTITRDIYYSDYAQITYDNFNSTSSTKFGSPRSKMHRAKPPITPRSYAHACHHQHHHGWLRSDTDCQQVLSAKYHNHLFARDCDPQQSQPAVSPKKTPRHSNSNPIAMRPKDDTARTSRSNATSACLVGSKTPLRVPTRPKSARPSQCHTHAQHANYTCSLTRAHPRTQTRAATSNHHHNASAKGKTKEEREERIFDGDSDYAAGIVRVVNGRIVRTRPHSAR